MTREHADQPGGALRDLVLPGPDHRPGGGAGVVGGDRTDLAAQSVALVAEGPHGNFLLAAMRRCHIRGTLITCRCGAC
jgi:hypothetical protein